MNTVSTTNTPKGGKLLRIVCAFALALTMMPAMAFTGVSKAFADFVAPPTGETVLNYSGIDTYARFGGSAVATIRIQINNNWYGIGASTDVVSLAHPDKVAPLEGNSFDAIDGTAPLLNPANGKIAWMSLTQGVKSYDLYCLFKDVKGDPGMSMMAVSDHDSKHAKTSKTDMQYALLSQISWETSPEIHLVYNVDTTVGEHGKVAFQGARYYDGEGGSAGVDEGIFAYLQNQGLPMSEIIAKMGEGKNILDKTDADANHTGAAAVTSVNTAGTCQWDTGDDLVFTVTPDAGYVVDTATSSLGSLTKVNDTTYKLNVAEGNVTSAAAAASVAFTFRQSGPNPAYKVEHYVQKTSGSGYELIYTDTRNDTAAGNPVTATALTTGTQNGVDFTGVTQVTNASEVLTGNVAADGSTVLKVYYDRNTVTLTFVANDSTASITGSDTRTGLYGAPFTAPDVVNTDQLKVNQGWFDAASGGTAYTGTTLPAASKIVYAQWDSKATVTATAGAGGTVTPSGSIQYDLGATPTYTFAPNTGYCVDTATVVDTAKTGTTPTLIQDPGLSYTFGALAANGSISVKFATDKNNNGIPDYREIVFGYTYESTGAFNNPFPTPCKETIRADVDAVGTVLPVSPTWTGKDSAGTSVTVPKFPTVASGWDWGGWSDGIKTGSADELKAGTYTSSTTFTAQATLHGTDSVVNFRIRESDFGAISGARQLECYLGQALGSRAFPDVRSTDIPAGQWTKDMRTVSQFIGWYDVTTDTLVPGTGFSSVSTATSIEQFTTTNNANIATAKEALKNYVAANNVNTLEARFQKVDINLVPHDLTITRLFGDDRIGTAKAIADNALVTNATPENAIIVATAANFPDALTGASLAGAYNADIVLTDTDTLSAACKQALTSSSASKVFILGGTGAVSASVERQIRTIKPDTTRLGGADRMATAELIADCVTNTAKVASSTDTCVIAAAANFPDALSASAYAAYTKSPIFLTAFDGKSISATTLGKIKAGGYKNVIVVGGEMAVDAKVISQVKGAGISSVTRLGGADRYDTSARIADFEMNAGIGMSYDRCGIATGEKFPDALCGGAMQGRDGSVILLTATDSLSDSCASVLNANKNIITEMRFFGGTSAVSKNTVKAAVDCINHTPTLTWKPAGTQLF